MKGLLTFVGGLLAGAAVTALFTTPQGDELRYRIRKYLQQKGVIPTSQLDEFVEMIATSIEDEQK